MNITALDHHYVEDEYGFFYVVYGNRHPPGRLHAYLKYMPTDGATLWCKNNICYERVVKHYALNEMLSEAQRMEYEPVYGVLVPTLRLTGREKIYDPRLRLASLVSKPGDRLEENIAMLVDGFRGVVHPGSLGVTGSVLIGLHNPSLSDADITVYGCRDTLRLIEYVKETGLLSPLQSEALGEWARIAARIRGVGLKWVLSIYRPWRRGVYRGLTTSIIPVDDVARRYGETIYRSMGCSEVKVRVGGMQCSALYTPAEVEVESAEVLRGPSKTKPSRIISFDTLYSPLLYEGGELIITGETAATGSSYALLIGTRTCGGMIRKYRGVTI